MNNTYKMQVALLLHVLPEVAKEPNFAMHGGTAINLFVRDMPRLSVDIDLTYTEICERSEALDGINSALLRIKKRIEALRPTIRVRHRDKVCKLQIDEHGVVIKIEVNMVGRGLLGKPVTTPLCITAQEQFDVFCAMPLVSFGQLYGGKVCAALDRQHPRDLFDIKLLLDNEGFTDEIKQGFILGLISSNRPIHEMLNPNLQNQRIAFKNQFEGMSTIKFTYDDFECTRIELIDSVKARLSHDDRRFLLNLNRLTPDWSIYDYQNFPSVKWKLLNLQKFKTTNLAAYEQQLDDLQRILAP